jgi:hypothetical protein
LPNYCSKNISLHSHIKQQLWDYQMKEPCERSNKTKWYGKTCCATMCFITQFNNLVCEILPLSCLHDSIRLIVESLIRQERVFTHHYQFVLDDKKLAPHALDIFKDTIRSQQSTQ